MEDSRDGRDMTPATLVSSLRSRFENLGKDSEQKPTPQIDRPTPQIDRPTPQVDRPTPQTERPAPQIERRQPFLTVDDAHADRRPRTSGGESTGTIGAGLVSNGQPVVVPRKRRPDPPKARPQSMVSVTPSQKSPPMVTVDSPRSPGRNMSIDMRLASPVRPLTPGSAQGSPTRGNVRAHSRTASPALEARMSMFSQPTEAPPKIDFSSKPQPLQPKPEGLASNGPPPINRAAKPSVPKKPVVLAQKTNGLTAPEPSANTTDNSASPFSTPPSSAAASPERKSHGAPHHARHDSDASFVERLRSDSGASAVSRIRTDSDASFVQRIRGEPDATYADRGRQGSNTSLVQPSSVPRDSFQPPPVHHRVAAKREQHANGLSWTPTMPARYRPVHASEQTMAGDLPDPRPRLPARPELQIRSGRTSPFKPYSGRTSPSKLSQQIPARTSPEGVKRASTFGEPQSAQQRIPATKPIQRSALTQGFNRSTPTLAAPAPPAPRRSLDKRRDMPTPETPINGHSRDDDEEDMTPVESGAGRAVEPSDFPDSSQANRRPPRYKQRPYQIPTDYDTRLFAVCGDTVCTSGYLTKAWSTRTGEQLLNMAHNENTKVTSLVFKPSPNPNDEGKRLWLGTNIGEIHEVDIPSQHLIKSKPNAHSRREVIKMFRHGSELWTLDDGGELNVWKADHKGYPSLDSQYSNFRVPRGHTFSIVCGQHLWIACGKDLRVFNPSARTDTDFQVLRNALSQPGTGDITTGATLSSKPDIVYFGHADGKVSIYNCNDFSCAAVVNVSLYKISCLAGVGDYLWAGYNTGMTYVYDVSTTPWRVKKDWQAHEKQICSITADASALWKIDRLQVLTLGTDNMLRIWDGLLEEDWLELRMQEHDSDYCTFREISAAVMTWNAGACKPTDLQHSVADSGFLNDFMASRVPPDIFVFGFQELVDLEDKKVTAKSFFKSKKKDGNDQEHMSHQYRAWRDYLTRSIEDFMPTDQQYSLLHTASLVGLFTCVYVKASERSRIKYVHTAEVKRGMGGLHGNKGALILRLVLDDSSICFVNCHLAAGQTQTMNRNNDIAAILEAEALPSYPLNNMNSLAQHGDVFSHGGDGSMILDHEICILNGDLNYRIDTMGRDTVVKHVVQNNLSRLLDRDQLLLSRKKNPGFRLRAFQESPITFAPTYKYNVNSDEYDTSEKRRAPAWCDRILYRGLGKVKMEEYRRWEVKVSDHRPVSGHLRLRVKSVDPDRRERVWHLCLNESDQARVRIAKAVQHEYLINILGLSRKEAAQALSRKYINAA